MLPQEIDGRNLALVQLFDRGFEWWLCSPRSVIVVVRGH